ncbi:hypothetical protein KUTeg_015229 [Tegillarca granosa]|uniref:Uncharacterized protein n=1 Tax=Tegillarca granosa TaxID=220873 RepID=A0ABQ9EPQ4_TEGGR|nr:hypothetical protein KUTeg_015229 [Tegillarca granosa]
MKTFQLICSELMIGCNVIHLNILLILPFMVTSSALNVTIGFLVPKYGALSFGPEVDMDIISTINRCNNDANFTALRSAGIEFDYRISDTRCDTGTGLYEMVQLIQSSSFTEDSIHAFIDNIIHALIEGKLFNERTLRNPLTLTYFRLINLHFVRTNELIIVIIDFTFIETFSCGIDEDNGSFSIS